MARVLTAALLVAALVGVVPAGRASAASPAITSISLSGHGYGHGRGMGQYGALGYAVDQGWSYHQILDHFYGGTTSGTAPAATVMTVDMTSRDGQPTIVAQDNGMLSVQPAAGVTCTSGSPCSVMVARTGPGTWAVYQSTACNGGAGWKLTAGALNAAAVQVVATAGATDNRVDMLQLCEANGIRWLRGDVWAVDTGSSQATVNHVPLESYVRDVVPNESPASWGTLGAGAGEQALMAQAIASRSYAMAENRWSYAKTCDTTACQVYGGRAFQSSSGSFSDLEYANSDQATSSTAGEVRVFTAGGAIARTEFSSSTGGYSAGGTFPAVPDAGDATPSNPNHDWTGTVAAPAIQSAFGPSLGDLQGVQITGRNGLGDLGGRVTGLTIQFAGGTVTTTGAEFAGALGLRSDWFTVTGVTTTGGQPVTAPSGYDVLTTDGSVYPFGGATSFGSFNAAAAQTTAVGMATTHDGYLVLAGDGGVHVFGSAQWYGSLKGKPLNAPPFQVATTPDGGGYWIVAFDGGVFAYGNAGFHGSTGNMRLNQPVVGMAPTADGGGYWLVASDGGVFSFGDARFYGSTGNMRLNQPVIGMAPTADGKGYWLIASDGGVFSFGDARFAGSLPGAGIHERAVAVAASGAGYLVATQPGHVYGFGTSAAGGPATAGAAAPTVSLAVTR